MERGEGGARWRVGTGKGITGVRSDMPYCFRPIYWLCVDCLSVFVAEL
jgi:hypothetical protein